MPQYFAPTGRTVSADEALIAGRTLRDGYRMTLAHGEHVSFDIALLDGLAPNSTRVFLTDTAELSDAERECAIALARANHRLSTGYMGERAPPFTDAMAQAAIDAEKDQRQKAADVVRQAVTDTAKQITTSQAAYDHSVDMLNAWRL